MLVAAVLAPPADSGFTHPDWLAIGLVLAIVGSFLLANSILFRHPRQLVRERFGKERQQDLRTIREYIFHRVQVNLGFGFLLAGFGLQLYGRYRPVVGVEPAFPTLWIGIVVILAVALLLGSWWWSLLAFRRYVRQYFREYPPNFEADLALAREVGELFGLPSHGDDTVQSYVARLRMHLCAPPRTSQPARRITTPLERDEPELEETLA